MLRPGRAAPPGGKQPAATTKQPAAVAVEVHATSAASEQQGKGGAAASAVAILRQQSKLPELYLTPANGIEPERLDADSPPTASPSPAPRQHRRTSSAGEIAAGEIILDDFQMVPVVYSLTHTEATAAPTIFSVRTTLEDFEETELPGNDNVNENSNGIGNGDAAGSGSAPGVLDGEAAAAAVAAMGAARGDVKAAAAAVLAAPQDDVRPLQDSPRSRTPRDSTTIKRPYRHHTGWSGSLSAREEHTTDSHTFNIDSDTLNKQFAKLLASNTASPRYSRPETLEATSAIKARSNVRAAAAQVWQQLSPTKSLGALSLDEEEGAAGGTRRGVALRAAGSSIWGVAADAASLTSPVSSEASPKKLQELRRLWEV